MTTVSSKVNEALASLAREMEAVPEEEWARRRAVSERVGKVDDAFRKAGGRKDTGRQDRLKDYEGY